MARKKKKEQKLGKKGISLPIEFIVIIAIAVFVLVMIFAFFGSSIGDPMEKTAAQSAGNTGCPMWLSIDYCNLDSMGTPVPGYTYRGSDGTIKNICDVLYPDADGSRCAKMCCPGWTA